MTQPSRMSPTGCGPISNPGELLEIIRRHLFAYQPTAVERLRRNKRMHDVPDSLALDPRIIDAVLIDFLNYVGARYGVDYAISTSDLPTPGLLDKMARAAGAEES